MFGGKQNISHTQNHHFQPSGGSNGPAAFNAVKDWSNSVQALKAFTLDRSNHRWAIKYSATGLSQLSYDNAKYTVREISKRLQSAASFGSANLIAAVSSTNRSNTNHIAASNCSQSAALSRPANLATAVSSANEGNTNQSPCFQRSTTFPKFSGKSETSQEVAERCKRARDNHWALVNEASASEDYKEYSKDPDWRRRLSDAHSEILACCTSSKSKLEQAAELVRSAHPGRAHPDVNPTQLAVALQPAIEQGLLDHTQAQHLIDIVAHGITVEEFREVQDEALDLSEGNTEDPEDHETLLDFYYAQGAKGRVFLFPESDVQTLDSQGAVVLSPSFLVKVIGKNPRPICNLSSGNNGVNQRMEDMEANENGYTTIPGIAELIVQSYINMVQHPEKYGISDVSKIDLAMLVADASDAFYRVAVAAKAVGMQCTRVANITIVPLCCTFGWRRSAEVFSHITASIVATFSSNLAKATFLKPSVNASTDHLSPALKRLLADTLPPHSHICKAHVDDFAIVDIMQDGRSVGAEKDLFWAIKAHLGHGSISVKKFLASSFWSDFHKVIGGWFNTETFEVTMPHDKVCEVIAILDSDAFSAEQQTFDIDLCATLRGKLRWALLATKLGDSPALIGIEKYRQLGKAVKRKVLPRRFHGESQEMATAKFHNDMRVYRKLMYACRDNSSVATCSMVSLMPLQQRLKIPGQSKWLVWLSGDFSVKGQSFGIEMFHKDYGSIKRYSVVQHPPETIAALRKALRGESVKHTAVMSSVLERLNKFFGELQYRELLAGRPCIVLEDNQGSQATINSGYSANVLLQAIQLASNLRQSVDEAPMEAFYCNTENMSWMDKSSRMDEKFLVRMNQDLVDLGLVPWQYDEPAETVVAANEWLPHALYQKLPCLEELLSAVDGMRAQQASISVKLSHEEILQPIDNAWQDRVQAAAQPIPCYMGSFGPMAYSVEHLNESATRWSGESQLTTWAQLKQQNAVLATKNVYSLFDCYHGGCGGSIAAIRAGIFVKAGADNAGVAIRQFEDLTGRVSLGDTNDILHDKLPQYTIWLSCSSCKNFSALGDRKGRAGNKGGDHFELQFHAARAAGAKVVVIENVYGVATLQGGSALRNLESSAIELGYSRFFSKKVTFALYGDPENRTRIVIVAFHDSVAEEAIAQWRWPDEGGSTWSLYHDGRKCAGEVITHSSNVPERFWDDRPTYPIKRSWNKNSHLRICTVGFKNRNDTVGSPQFPSRVWHPIGLFPTSLASGQTGLVRTIWLRAMCRIYSTFRHWFEIVFRTSTGMKRSQSRINKCARCKSQRKKAMCSACATRLQTVYSSTKKQIGKVRDRRPMPVECLLSKGFPADTPFQTDSDGHRFAGDAVPTTWFEVLFKVVITVLDEGGVSTHCPKVQDEYVTWLVEPLHENDAIVSQQRWAGNQKRGHNVVHNKARDKLICVPLSQQELALMSSQADLQKEGRYAEDSRVAIELGWKHWRCFCLRFDKALLLKSNTTAEKAAAAAQAHLFITYETALFDIRAQSVAQKLWAVGSRHKSAHIEDPFSGNELVKAVIADAVALDAPQEPKIPVTNTTLAALRAKLDISQRPAFVLWAGIRFAIAFLCRISEWAVNDKHTVIWSHIVFYTAKDSSGGRRKLIVTTASDVWLVAEMQVIFYSDKTAKPGYGRARSFFAIDNRNDTRCIVRDIARLWLISERVPDYDVFSWNANTDGVSRKLVNQVLKAAAVETGIPGADVSSHSLRCTGLCRLLHAKMPWELAKQFGRWRSDCALRYFWASTELAADYAASIWNSACFVRVRGRGDVDVQEH